MKTQGIECRINEKDSDLFFNIFLIEEFKILNSVKNEDMNQHNK